MVEFGSCGSVTDCSSRGIADRGSAKDYSVGYGIDYTDMSGRTSACREIQR